MSKMGGKISDAFGWDVEEDGPDCELCRLLDGHDMGQGVENVVFQGLDFHVVLVDDPNYPGFCRVIWRSHVPEMTDLAPEDRSELMQAVCKVEAAVREVMRPHKVNLASLGNMTPHLHWHVIPRYEDDAHFPNPIWGEVKREVPEATLKHRRGLLDNLRAAILGRLAA